MNQIDAIRITESEYLLIQTAKKNGGCIAIFPEITPEIYELAEKMKAEGTFTISIDIFGHPGTRSDPYGIILTKITDGKIYRLNPNTDLMKIEPTDILN